ncbi:GYD domain-containing protein [Ancylobacter sp. Lp-2]|uniref:GYD domain-containing protein n=1 Tax=Ancylobacter sp. Lp-2 TaxID=2881339 RepID=UPI001E314EEE|nr:GYD domain-containing protein [Ancylobacter sp. Lp-2]MCB4768319.1 GYD domain-containing protein [Ancylobacter sp. Lp-2]
MPIYITRGRYSAESIKNLVANPEDRSSAVRNLVEASGAKLLHFYVTLGRYDFLVITEAANAKEASAFILAAAAAGGVTDNETTEAFTAAEAKEVFAAAGKAAKKYKPPGK